ncbi:MAG: beta-hydroxyacyl-ACP dehydratase [Planctomycetota bacterium]
MRWMWIDRVVELVPREKLVAIKNVSLAEEHLHDHFAATADRPALPVMPGSLVVEGMAQTAGILVGHAEGFREKVILAKVSKATLERDATPGCQIRHTAQIRSLTDQGASTLGTVELRPAGADEFETIGRIDLIFSHLDKNTAGVEYPEHNFVFGEGFKTLLRTSGIEF